MHTNRSEHRARRTRKAMGASSALHPLGLLDGLPDAVLGWDSERRIVAWNLAARRIYGYTAAEALGRRPSELLSTRFPMPLTEVIRTLADSGCWAGRLVQTTKDGRELTVESRWLARFDEHGQVHSAMSVDRDISARLEDQWEGERLKASAEHELIESRLHNLRRLESVGQIAGGVAHDFNNMLAVVINYAGLVAGELTALARESPDDDQRWRSMKADLDEVVRAAERAARLTHQLLSFSRQTQTDPVPVDLNDSVREVEELLRHTLGPRITLDVALADQLALIRADPAEIDHLLVNLAINSRDAMPDGGTVTVETANVEIDPDYAAPRLELLAGGHVRLRVSDTGIGMAPEILEHAFDPFFTTKPLGQGTGLGLTTVFGTVRRAHGRAEISSEPGAGTTFTALFPVATAEPLQPAPPAATATATAAADLTILLVEDELALRNATRRILARAGYTVLAAESAAAALEAADAHAGRIDLLLTDIVMPGMRGDQLAEELCRMRPSLPVLFMSGFAGPGMGSAMELAGAELIAKPFTGERLLERIATLQP